ncbi:hypothetical protein [Thermus hydrothermalis]|uniref:hypothetical protein n=1 Tax=Thermus hydrothermalis TaxID=2908148 RepID=UPI001FAA9692|nr:hypothetical protein [Thermus hydrothermalis]
MGNSPVRRASHERDFDQLACEFFKLFARFECALKKMGYYLGGNRDVKVDWDRFAREVGSSVLQNGDPKIKEAVDYLFNNPPKRQVDRGGRLVWEEARSRERSARVLFRYIRTVRNNLFHGEKLGCGQDVTARDKRLVECSLTVLNQIRKAHKELAKYLPDT